MSRYNVYRIALGGNENLADVIDMDRLDDLDLIRKKYTYDNEEIDGQLVINVEEDSDGIKRGVVEEAIDRSGTIKLNGYEITKTPTMIFPKEIPSSKTRMFDPPSIVLYDTWILPLRKGKGEAVLMTTRGTRKKPSEVTTLTIYRPVVDNDIHEHADLLYVLWVFFGTTNSGRSVQCSIL